MLADEHITLESPLTLRNAFQFPLQSRASRRDLIIGGYFLLIPIVGWLLNMGHRIVVTHRLLHGEKEPWPAWDNLPQLLKHGLTTFAGMVLYHLPATIIAIFAYKFESVILSSLAAILWLMGTCVIPGYMTAYSVNYDQREVFNIIRSIRRVLNARRAYWHAWAITLCAMLISFVGLLGFGVLFFWTSVWFWQVAAYCFANTMTHTRCHAGDNVSSMS
jgi:Protein of unknown function (DUF4013)